MLWQKCKEKIFNFFVFCIYNKFTLCQRHVYHCVTSPSFHNYMFQSFGNWGYWLSYFASVPTFLFKKKCNTYKIQFSMSVETLLSDKQANWKIMYFITSQKNFSVSGVCHFIYQFRTDHKITTECQLWNHTSHKHISYLLCHVFHRFTVFHGL